MIGNLFLITQLHAQTDDLEVDSSTEDSIAIDCFLTISENALIDYYKDLLPSVNSDSIINSLGYSSEDVPVFSDSIYCERLDYLNEASPFHLDCNEHTLNTIRFFADKRRNFTRTTLARSTLYFPLFEEKLAHYNLPLELKYLSVIESGLRPQIKSRSGALGLWQFMYGTGKMYGLKQDSYIDERMDPEKATEAACKYLEKLFSIYKDWNMALAAYNAGPGNVNKAIRRSGGKMTYWEIRSFLPRETQGYVPNFVAMNYMMNYFAEHNITPLEEVIHEFELDTVCTKKGIHMKTIDSVLQIPLEKLVQINPIYKTDYIPKTNPPQCFSLPVSFIKDWIALEDSIYRIDSIIYASPIIEEESVETTEIVHYVKSGENLSVIASRYKTTVKQIMNWNNLTSTNLKIGQKLILFKNGDRSSLEHFEINAIIKVGIIDNNYS